MKKIFIVLTIVSLTLTSCEVLLNLNLPNQSNYEKIRVDMEENEFKEKHRKARSCFMDNNTSVYFIWYRGNIETNHDTFSKFYYFESGKLTSSDYGEKADGMGLNCDGGSQMN